MPKEGFAVITIKQEIYEKIKRHLEEANRIAGYEKYRSVAQYVEACIASFNGSGHLSPEAQTISHHIKKKNAGKK